MTFGLVLLTSSVSASLTSHPDSGACKPARPLRNLCHVVCGPCMKLRGGSLEIWIYFGQVTTLGPQFFHQWNGDKSHAS